jgi:hypothetical protein
MINLENAWDEKHQNKFSKRELVLHLQIEFKRRLYIVNDSLIIQQ